MSSFEVQIKAASPQNTSLLTTLNDTANDAAIFKQQSQAATQLQNDIAHNDAEIDRFTDKREKLQFTRKYDNSSLRKFGYKLTGRQAEHDEKSSAAEKIYLDTIQAEHKAKEHKTTLATQLENVMRLKAQHSSAATQHALAQKDLDALYTSLFDGPTPSFPEEDTHTLALQRATLDRQSFTTPLQTAQQVKALLQSALSQFPHLQKFLCYALENAVSDGKFLAIGASWWESHQDMKLAREIYLNIQTKVAEAHGLAGYVEEVRGVVMPGQALMEDEGMVRGVVSLPLETCGPVCVRLDCYL